MSFAGEKKWGLSFWKGQKALTFSKLFWEKKLTKKFVLRRAECSCYNKTTPLCRPTAHNKNFVAWLSVKTHGLTLKNSHFHLFSAFVKQNFIFLYE